MVLFGALALSAEPHALAEQQSDTVLLERIEAAWQHRQNSLSRLKLTLKGTYTYHRGSIESSASILPTSDVSGPYELHLSINKAANQVRKALRRPLWNFDRRIVRPIYQIDMYDGTTHQRYKPREINAELDPAWHKYRADIKYLSERVRGLFFTSEDYPLLASLGYSALPSVENLSVEVDFSQFSVEAKIAVDGRQHAVLVSPGMSPRVAMFQRLWIDLERDFVLTKWQLVTNGVISRETVATYSAHPTFGWRIDHWENRSGNEAQPMFSQSLRVTDIDFAPEFDPEEFGVAVEEGMIVNDLRASETAGGAYVAGRSGRPARLVRDLVREDAATREFTIILTVVFAFIAFGCLAFWWWRRRVSRQ